MYEQTVSERIAQMVEHYAKGNKSAFAKAVGISNQSLGEIVGSRKSAPSFAALQKICIAFPEVRMEWLVMGKGEMLNSKSEKLEDPFAEAFTADNTGSGGVFRIGGLLVSKEYWEHHKNYEDDRRKEKTLLRQIIETLIEAAPAEKQQQAEQARALLSEYTFEEKQDSYHYDTEGKRVDD